MEKSTLKKGKRNKELNKFSSPLLLLLLLFTLFTESHQTTTTSNKQQITDKHQPINKLYEECINISDCEDQCECVKENKQSPIEECRNDAGFINYEYFYYCLLSGHSFLAILLIISFNFFLLSILFIYYLF